MRQQRLRGTPAFDLPAEQFVLCLQNHDQVANSGHGLRAKQLTSAGRYRAMTALMLLAPGTPMFFQGQEFAASAPFLYFADHETTVAEMVRTGRHHFLRQFPSLTSEDADELPPNPCLRQTFESCKLDFCERERHAEDYRLHADLLALRRSDPVFESQRAERMFGAVLAAETFCLRFFGDDGDDRIVLVNLGRDVNLQPLAEPLLAPPPHGWQLLWSSESPKYGGAGSGNLNLTAWTVPGHSAAVLSPRLAPAPSWPPKAPATKHDADA